MSLVEFKKDESLGQIILNDPPFNLLSENLFSDLNTAINTCKQSNIRALLIMVNEGNFSAGADIKLFINLNKKSAYELLNSFGNLLNTIENLPFPTMSAVRGLCIGGGFELSLACDLIWSSDNSQFAAAEALIGIIPLGGGTRMIAQRAGSARAKEITYSGRFFKASQLENWNIINRVLSDSDVNTKAITYMKSLANGPTLAHNVTKTILKGYFINGDTASYKLLLDLVPPLFETNDVKAGLESFIKEGPGKAKFLGN
jgi:enoyl-CoA hydratase/carnithine racemase